jgi:hypothetical protein
MLPSPNFDHDAVGLSGCETYFTALGNAAGFRSNTS